MTSRSNGKGYAWLKLHLSRYILGWLKYYHYADMKTFIVSTNKWYNRRLRMYIWKNWKLIRTRSANLQKCGIPKWKAWQWANTRKGYWRISKSWILTRAITIERLVLAGYPSILNLYIKLHRSCENRRMPNGTYSSVLCRVFSNSKLTIRWKQTFHYR